MEYQFKKGQPGAPLLILFHGTGGDEYSLLPIANHLMPQASILALRGQVNENGALRFFKRHAEGQFDKVDLDKKGEAIQDWLNQFGKNMGFPLESMILVGFSNGANMALHLLKQNQSPFKKAILFAPMYPLPFTVAKEKEAQSIFLSMGTNDLLVSLEESHRVQNLFAQKGANIETFWVSKHEINYAVLEAAKRWLEKQ